MIRATWDSNNSFERDCFVLVLAYCILNKNISPHFLSLYSFGKNGLGNSGTRMFSCKSDKRTYVFNLLSGVKL